MATLDLPDLTLWYERFGTPDPARRLLVFNGSGATIEASRPLIDKLAEHFDVAVHDQRCLGRTGLPPTQPTMADYAADAVAVLDAAQAPRAHWCGLSLGGQTAMWAALHHAGRIRRLVLANTGPHLAPPSNWDDRIATALSKGMGPLAEAVPARWFTAGFRERDKETVAKTVEMVRGTQPRGYAEACAALRDTDLRHELGSIAVPTLVIAGAQDAATPVEYGEFMVESIPGSDLLVLDAAHLSNVEQPEDFGQALVDFLRD